MTEILIFNLACNWFGKFSSIAKLNLQPILFLTGQYENIIGNPWSNC